MTTSNGSATGTVTNGGTVTTDPDGTGASATVPVQTSITAPASVSGTISITAHDTSSATPSGYALFGKEVDLSGPAATANSPYQVTFTLDSSFVAGLLPGDVSVFRNSVGLSNCASGTTAAPDPCIAARTTSGDDTLITVRTSHFSTWSFGRPVYAVRGPSGGVYAPPTVNTTRATSAVPITFTLGGDRGLDVFRAGYPSATTTICAPKATYRPVKVTVSSKNSVLVYDRRSGQYIYVWKSPKTPKTCVTLNFVFHDGSTLTTRFKLT